MDAPSGNFINYFKNLSSVGQDVSTELRILVGYKVPEWLTVGILGFLVHGAGVEKKGLDWAFRILLIYFLFGKKNHVY